MVSINLKMDTIVNSILSDHYFAKKIISKRIHSFLPYLVETNLYWTTIKSFTIKNYSIISNTRFILPFFLIWYYYSLYWNPGYNWPYRWSRNSIWMEYTILYCWTHQEQIIVYLKVLGSYESKNPILNVDLKWYD